MGAQSLWYRRRSLPPQKPYSSSWPMHTRICWSGFNDPSGVDLPGRTPVCSQDRRHRPGTRRNAAAGRCGRRLAPMTWQHRARLNPCGVMGTASGTASSPNPESGRPGCSENAIRSRGPLGLPESRRTFAARHVPCRAVRCRFMPRPAGRSNLSPP